MKQLRTDNKKFLEWFKKEQSKLNNAKFLKVINQIEIKDLKKWALTQKPSFLQKCSIIKAVAEVEKSQKAKEKEKSNKLEFKKRLLSHSQEEVEIREQFHGKSCFLNGYPAILLSTKEEHLPIVISSQNCLNEPGGDRVVRKSWVYVKKFFPFFMGGRKMYKLTDTIDDIKKRIEQEHKRNIDLPSKEYILAHLNWRLRGLRSPNIKIKADNNHHIPHPLYNRQIVKGMKYMERERQRDIELLAQEKGCSFGCQDISHDSTTEDGILAIVKLLDDVITTY